MLRLIRFFWDNAVLVCRAGGCYGTPFRSHRGVTQGGPFSPRIFNVMVDAIVREWLRLVLGDEVAASGVGERIRQFLVAFYADDGLVQSSNPTVLQKSFDMLIALFERVGLVTNTSKTKTMVCIPGRIRTRLPEDVYATNREGLHSRADWKKREVKCHICDRQMSAASLNNHLETQHDIFRSFVLNRDLELADLQEEQVYTANFSIATNKWNAQ